jgi:enamine deaminase RidA (YjgF/YER057c/UK114 family)
MLSHAMNRWIAIFIATMLVFLSYASLCPGAQIGGGAKAPVIRPPKNAKKAELPNQALEQPPQLPLALPADGTRLSFLAAPLSNHGLLSQQTREALKWMMSQAHGAQFVRVRAFVAGSGDLRRVPQLVSEAFADKHLSLPVVVTLQVGALWLEGAQVQLEATLQQARPVNPSGVSIVAFGAETSEAALSPFKQAGELLRATCYVPSVKGQVLLDGVVWIQPQRQPAQTTTWCEGVARLTGPAVTAQPLVFTGAQMAFSYSEEDARLAYERLEKTLKSANSTLKNAVFLSFYPLSSQLAELARRIGPSYLDGVHRPAGIRTIVFEGLPSMDGSFAIEAVATVSNPN